MNDHFTLWKDVRKFLYPFNIQFIYLLSVIAKDYLIIIISPFQNVSPFFIKSIRLM